MNLATRSKDSWSKITKPPYTYSISKQGRSYLVYLARKPRNKGIDSLPFFEIDDDPAEDQLFVCGLEALMRMGRYSEVKHLYCYYKDSITGRARSHAEDLYLWADTAGTGRFQALMSQGISARDMYDILSERMVPELARNIIRRHYGEDDVERAIRSDWRKTEPPKATQEDELIKMCREFKEVEKETIMTVFLGQVDTLLAHPERVRAIRVHAIDPETGELLTNKKGAPLFETRLALGPQQSPGDQYMPVILKVLEEGFSRRDSSELIARRIVEATRSGMEQKTLEDELRRDQNLMFHILKDMTPDEQTRQIEAWMEAGIFRTDMEVAKLKARLRLAEIEDPAS